jgi:hypothetical protein
VGIHTKCREINYYASIPCKSTLSLKSIKLINRNLGELSLHWSNFGVNYSTKVDQLRKAPE